MEERKGVLTPEQEKALEKFYKASGLVEKFDGAIIKLTDNIVLEKLKAKLPEEYHKIIYDIVDTIMEAIIIDNETVSE